MNRRISDPQTPRRGPGPEGAGDEASDEELARRFVATADHGTFVALVERHLPAVRRLLAGLFNGVAEDIEDAQQEILATLYVGMDRFRFQSSFRTYFYRLCRNTAIDMLRRKGRERRRVEAAAREAQALSRRGREGRLRFRIAAWCGTSDGRPSATPWPPSTPRSACW